MRSVSWSCSSWTTFVSIYSNICSISWVKSHSYDYSPCLLNANCSDESITFMGIISSMCAWWASWCSCSYCDSFSLLHNSSSSLSCCFNSCNSFSASSSFWFSLRLRTIILLCCHLFASISKADLNTRGSDLNLQLFYASMLLVTFLLHFPCTRLFPSATTGLASLWDDVSFCIANHSKTTLAGSLSLEEL